VLLKNSLPIHGQYFASFVFDEHLIEDVASSLAAFVLQKVLLFDLKPKTEILSLPLLPECVKKKNVSNQKYLKVYLKKIILPSYEIFPSAEWYCWEGWLIVCLQ
jgi:hypothetical protein